MFSSNILIPLCAAGVLATVAAAQTPQSASKPQLTPRELFYSASPDAAAAHKSQSKSSGSKGATGAKNTKNTTTAKQDSGAASNGAPHAPDGTTIIDASSGPPIGITYTLRKKVGDAMVDVAPESTFRKDDRIDFIVQANYPGYLYIGNKGPDGSWNPLFPAREIDNGDNRVEAFHKYTIPPGYRIKFDEKTGVEEVFILFSREPVPDFEKLLYADKGGAAAGKSTPAQPKPLNVAKADLPAATVDRLRDAYTRDLLIEKIDDDKPGDHKEKAVYIVNPTGASDS